MGREAGAIVTIPVKAPTRKRGGEKSKEWKFPQHIKFPNSASSKVCLHQFLNTYASDNPKIPQSQAEDRELLSGSTSKDIKTFPETVKRQLAALGIPTGGTAQNINSTL